MNSSAAMKYSVHVGSEYFAPISWIQLLRNIRAAEDSGISDQNIDGPQFPLTATSKRPIEWILLLAFGDGFLDGLEVGHVADARKGLSI